ncbi:MAG TPA: hypothetical protein VEJ41_06265 [Candidatus Acidoferrales bacterium]|nr:hypothetical protein [Candidatus Acidoferrales bacterium]
MTLRFTLTMLALVALLSPALARTTTVASGTTIYGTSNSTISSKGAYEGQVFSFTVRSPFPNGDAGFAGAKLWARVVTARKAGQGTKPQLSFILEKITMSNGSSSPIYANLLSVQENQKSNVGTVAIGAVAGMVAGNILGKWLGTNIGGAVGLTAGTLYALNSKTDVSIPEGGEAKFQLTRTLTVSQ